MEAVARHAEAGRLVIGICNGFQILCEAGLLPGALMRNDSLQFRCQDVHLRVENTGSPFTRLCRAGDRCCACPSPTARAATTPDEATLDQLDATAASRSATARRTARSRPRRTPTARCATSPASSTSGATCWA